jgi:hypothetical protein
MTTAVQNSLFDAPVSIYGDFAPHRNTPTSRAGAAHIAPKAPSLRDRVVLALYAMPGLTDAGLDRYLGVENGRSARPRRNELMHMGLVAQMGTCEGEAGVLNATWCLTAAGEAQARELSK